MTTSALTPTRRAWLSLIAIVAVAAGVRYWQLSSLPPGLWYDEAHKALVALEIAAGQRFPIYVTDIQGLEAGYFWLLAGWIRVFGAGFHTSRFLSALLGTITIPIAYASLRILYRGHPRARLIAILAAAWLAVLLWHVHWSRLGLETITVPLFAVALFGLLAYAWQRRSVALFALTGLTLGLSQYTNPGARVLVLQAALTFLILARGPVRQGVVFGLACALAALVAYLPLGLFFLREPEWFFGRLGLVSAGTRAGGLAVVMASLGRTFLALNFAGDTLVRHNLAQRPAFDPLASLAMVGGLLALWRWRARWRAHLALLAALVVNLLPTILSDGAPGFGRALGATPFIVTLPALGLALLVDLWPRRAWPRLVAAALLTGSAVWNLTDYFTRYERQAGLFDGYEVGLWRVTQAAAAAAREGTGVVIVAEPEWVHPTVRYTQAIAPGDLRVINGAACLAYPAAATVPAVLAVLAGRETPLLTQYPSATVIPILHEPEPYPYGYLLELPAGAQAASAGQPPLAEFGGALTLAAFSPAPAEPRVGEVATFSFRWLAHGPLDVAYHVFVHLAAPDRPYVSGVDAEPCGQWYPATGWHANEYIEHDLTLPLPETLRPGPYRLMVGVYNWQTGERLPVSQSDAIEPDRAYLGDLAVKP